MCEYAWLSVWVSITEMLRHTQREGENDRLGERERERERERDRNYVHLLNYKPNLNI